MNKQAEFDMRQFGDQASGFLNNSKDLLKQLLIEYPALKTIGLTGLAGLVGNVGGRAANSLGFNINPSLTGLVGASIPLITELARGSQTFDNINRYGIKGLYTPMSSLRSTPNRPGYVVKNLSRQMSSGAVDKKPHELIYGDLTKDSPIFDARTDYQKRIDDANAKEIIKNTYS